MSVKVYVLDRLPSTPDCFLLQLLLGAQKDIDTRLFQSIDTRAFTTMVTFVHEPQDADIFFLPHSYFLIYKNKKYIQKIIEYTERYSKKVLVFSYSDISRDITLPNAIILRSSRYKKDIQHNEVIIPAFVQDLGLEHAITNRTYCATRKPVVGFAGWVTLDSLKKKIVYIVTVYKNRITQLRWISPSLQGIFFRKKTILKLKKSIGIETLFFIRDSYSANRNTISGDPQKIRSQFISAITDSDFPLCVRGDGNYSLRFYEILSLGRIPLFIDTDCALPLEDIINYDACMLRVDYTEIDLVEKKVLTYWEQLTPEVFLEKQMHARQVFETYLRADVFYTNFFKTIKQML